MSDLFSQSNAPDASGTPVPTSEVLAPGIVLIKGLLQSSVYLKHIQDIVSQAPLRHMMTPMGYPTKIAMTNCGHYGWVSSPHGYQYSATDPLSNLPWPSMPPAFIELAQQAALLAGIRHFTPDACLINQYEIGHSLGRHQDKDEADFKWPIVSVSMGLQAVFQLFPDTPKNAHHYLANNLPNNQAEHGQRLTQKTHNILLQDGDILVIHGPARLRHHGIKPIKADLLRPHLQHRYNLTFRRAR